MLPYQADFTRCLDTTSKQESQGFVRFARKNEAMPAKITELVIPPQTTIIYLRIHLLFSGSPPDAVAPMRKPTFDELWPLLVKCFIKTLH